MELNFVFDHRVAIPWSDLRKSRSFLGLWGGGNPGSGAKRRRTGRGQESPATKALRKQGTRAYGVTGYGHPVIKYEIGDNFGA
jgi:hypothetical protein